MQESKIRDVILGVFQGKASMKDIAGDENFFGRGISSLTVVELQILVEKELRLTAETSDLMRTPTINDWVAIYAGKLHGAEGGQEKIAVA